MSSGTPEQVIIVGGGPVGLVMAMRLGHFGIPAVVVEADEEVSRALKASTFHPPTLDMLDEYGITPGLIAAGLVAPTWQVRMHETGEYAEFDLSALKDETPHPYRLQTEQWKLSELLLAHIRAKLPGTQVLMGYNCVAIAQDEHGVRVTVETAGKERKELSGRYLIGADGARSMVRAALDLSFEGHTFPETTVLATTSFPFHEHIPTLSYINYCWAPTGTFSLLRLPGLWRASLYPWEGESIEDATRPESIQKKLQHILPRDEPYDIMEIRPYRIHQRVVDTYVNGRIVLAGDAAHINSPSGGMGMNGGIHDAFNLSEKLRRIYAGENADALLGQYERQRRPIAIRHVLQQSGRNRARMQERGAEQRRKTLEELLRKAGDPALAREYLLETSMILSLREAAAIE
ncbi:6-hydroxy-3-succinoylpyridine 3-monooxygenase HspB [Pigmentiphaga humi]|uniref:6-hydroxy-3-succinoylpyridine 3-monooxygenase HspB n=1 Tax=Pigmentiphaga humi TaxID=2478468 RepID=A0A3P4AXG5_9BURK|nr:FAD-dependent monooxygenase [Pigmentiphaga humi]VCU68753.1 6-hydroxy-3-succinoylpyridine 3-monooxygenase HspB [Pigmentiphaga humi]